jgi:hypothetical protein
VSFWDGKKGTLQLGYGLLTDLEGRQSSWCGICSGLEQMAMIGDRGVITSARIAALDQLKDRTARPDTYGWVTVLLAPAIRKLIAGEGPLHLALVEP